jgi:signal transduction histidine kinase
MINIIAPNKTIALFGVRICNIGYILIPVLFLHFILALLKINKLKRRILYLAYTVNFFMHILNFTELYIKDLTPKLVFEYYPLPGILYPLYVLMFFSYIGYAYYELLKGYMRSTGIERNQIRYVFVASTIGFSGGITVFLPVFNINVYPFGYLFFFLYSVVITYAIVKHRLMDITFVIKKGVTYAYASLLLLIPLFLLVIYGQQVAFSSVSYPFSFFMLVVIVTAAYFFPRVKVRAEKTVEQIIFKNKYDYKKTISELSRAMVSILSTSDLCQEIITTTTEAMRVEKASIYILDEEKGFYELYESMGLGEEKIVAHYHKEDPFFRWVEKYKEIFIKEELERSAAGDKDQAVIERMDQMESEICIPLVTKQKLIGVINLGMKSGGGMYTHEDLDLLATLANQATIAVENARLYEDISRAKVQMQRADRLASLGTLTAGLAHEIRNPLVAIKTFTQLLPERFDDDEFRDHFLHVTVGEVDRISSLVNELLEFARPSQPNLNKEDLNQIMEKMLLLVASASHEKNLEIVRDFHQSLPPVVLDKEQIKQVFLNILLNAIDATSENGTITVGTKLVKKSGYQDAVKIMVRDTGKGIPKEDLERIFTPFFTTKHQGSGLGLAISHQIVQEHHGSIEVESEESKGTTFCVTLSVNPQLTQKEKKQLEAIK